MKNLTLIFVASISIMLGSALAPAQAQANASNANSTTSPEAKAVSTPTTESSSLPLELKQRVRDKYEEYATYSTRWSGAYWGFVFGATILGALGGILLKLDALKDIKIFRLSQSDIAALLAGAAALLIAISTGGDFAGKWRANRTAKNRAEQLSNEMFSSKLTADEIVTKLNKIIDDQNNGVINVKDVPK
jgi:hypothetical protein